MRRFVWVTLLLIVAFLINFLSRKKLLFPYSDLLSYNELYYTDEYLRISNLSSTPEDSLLITFKGKGIKENNLFEVFSNNQLLVKQQRPFLVIKPPVNQKKIFIRINSAPEKLEINIDYTPLYVYKEAGNSNKIIYEVTSNDIPITGASLHKISDWQTPDLTSISPNIINRYLQDSMHITNNDSSDVAVSKIADFIFKKTYGQIGLPSDSLSNFTPMEQLEFVHNGKSKIWCGNFSYIFSFFASKAGLPVRIVNCGGNINNVSVGDHSFNEVYLRELHCWAHVDLTSQNVFVKKGRDFLNTIEIQHYLRHEEDTRDLTAYHFDGTNITPTPFADVNSLALYYFHPGNSFYFFYGDYLKKKDSKNILERVAKFFYAKPNQAVYSDNISTGNEQFYIRLVSNYLLVALFILWLITAGTLLLVRYKNTTTGK